jgi:hypothetical protein
VAILQYLWVRLSCRNNSHDKSDSLLQSVPQYLSSFVAAEGMDLKMCRTVLWSVTLTEEHRLGVLMEVRGCNYRGSSRRLEGNRVS